MHRLSKSKELCAATLVEIVGRAAVIEVQHWIEWKQRSVLLRLTQFLQAAWTLPPTLGGMLPLQATNKATLNLILQSGLQGNITFYSC